MADGRYIPAETIRHQLGIKKWLKNSHFLHISEIPASHSNVSSSSTCCMWSSNDLENIMTLFMCTDHVFHLYIARLISSARWYEESALFSPKGMRVHSWSLSWDVNAVFSLSPSARDACQNPLRASRVENIRASPNFLVLSAKYGTE